MAAQGSSTTTSSSLQNSQTDGAGNETISKYDILNCNYLYYYETCYTYQLNQDDYDLTIDIDYFWGMFESTGASPVDRKNIYKRIQMYLNNPEKYNLSKIVNKDTKKFCPECKKITDKVL